MPEIKPNLTDQFLDRVRRSYEKAIALQVLPAGALWEGIGKRQAAVHEALTGETNTALREIFNDPASTDLFYGTDTMCSSVLVDGYKEEWFAELVTRCRDDLFNMAKAFGFQRVPAGPEFHGPDWVRPGPDSLNVEAFLQLLDRYLNQHVDFPAPFRGEMGFKTARGTAGYRAIQAIYQATQLRNVSARAGLASVLEIGPGMGRTAYYAYRSGLTDYTTVDLPMGVVAQACFLGATLGPDKLWLLGDDPYLAAGKIKLSPAGTEPPDRVGIVFNADSLTEMPHGVAAGYAAWVSKNSEIFLSVNHEENEFTVSQLFPNVPRDRSQYWIREGYLEETFYFSKPPKDIEAPPRLKRILDAITRRDIRT